MQAVQPKAHPEFCDSSQNCSGLSCAIFQQAREAEKLLARA